MRNAIGILVLLVIFAVPCHALTLSPEEIRTIPSTGAKLIQLPNGDVYLVAASIEEVIEGIPLSYTLEMASLRARTTLAQYINGETFKKIIETQKKFVTAGKSGITTSLGREEITSIMKEKALKEVEVILEDISNPKVIKVVVGVRFTAQNN